MIWVAAVGLLLLGGLGLAVGVMISIKKDGHETKLNVPSGSDLTIADNGDVEVKLPPTPPATRSVGPSIGGKTNSLPKELWNLGGASASADVYAGVEGTIYEFGTDSNGKPIEHGSWVKKGQVLLKLRNPALTAAKGRN